MRWLERALLHPLERLNDRMDDRVRSREEEDDGAGLSPVQIVVWCAVLGFGLVALAAAFTR